MKSILMSIKPKYCELIANGSKTIEVRKTKPNIDEPFKCYIYCTKDGIHNALCVDKGNSQIIYCFNYNTAIYEGDGYIGNGYVIGEFVCDRVVTAINGNYAILNKNENCSCLNAFEIMDYAEDKTLYGYHISDLKIYDKPKELGEFYRLDKPIICNGENCETCGHLKYMRVNTDEFDYDCDCNHHLENRISVTRPPESWMYVEELE